MRKILLALLLIGHVYLVAGEGISLANEYQKNSALQWQWAMDSLRNINIESSDKILDVGSGDGKITAWVADTARSGVVIGIDISKSMLHKASNNFKKNNLLFLEGSATAIPFSDQFDKVVSFSALHWVLDQEKALKSIKNALRPGGIALLVLPGKTANNLFVLSQKVALSQKWEPYFKSFKQERVYYSLEEYRDLLSRAGFKIQSMTQSESIANYSSRQSLIHWIRPLVTFIDHLSPDLQDRFIEDIADQMLLNDALLSDGSVAVKHMKIEVIALNPFNI